MDEWAERLLSLADKAFSGLPESYVISEVISKLCLGCLDKHAGSVASSFGPKTVEEALERIKWQQYNDTALFGPKVRTRDPRDIQDLASEPGDGETLANVVKTESHDKIGKTMDKLSETLDKNLKMLQSNLNLVQENVKSVQNRVDQKMQTVQQDVRSMERRWKSELEKALDKVASTRSSETTENSVNKALYKALDNKQTTMDNKPVKRDRSNYQCYHCQEWGHIFRNCPKKHVKFNLPTGKSEEPLNPQGPSA